AINAAMYDKHHNTTISVSWGAPENEFGTRSDLLALSHLCELATQNGMNITVASGDKGSSDGEGSVWTSLNVDFPASSPFVVACGATTLSTSPSYKETAWSWNSARQWGSGGGLSSIFPVPSYQATIIPAGLKTPISFRAVPDISTV